MFKDLLFNYLFLNFDDRPREEEGRRVTHNYNKCPERPKIFLRMEGLDQKYRLV